MQATLLSQSKISLGDEWRFQPPALPRPLIIKQKLLNQLAETPLVASVVAPSGYGKTVLSAQLFAQWQGVRAWCTFADIDLRLHDLVRILIGACQHALQFDEALLQRIQQGLIDDPKSLLESLLQQLADNPTPTLLILDNLPKIDTQDTLSALDQLIEQWPKQHKLLINSSATEWQKHLSITNIAALCSPALNTIRFDDKETIALLGDSLSPALQSLALPFIDGSPAITWIAKNACLNKQELEAINSPEELIEHGQRKITAALPPAAREFILASSLMDYFNLTLVEQMLEHDCHSLLPGLLKQQLLLGQNDDQGWFHFHQLWRVKLRQVLLSENADLAKGLVRRAATWWMNHKQPRQAIYLARTTDDVQLMQQLVAEHGWLMFQRGYHQLLKETLLAIPETIRKQDPALLMVAAKVLLIDDVPAAHQALDQLAAHIVDNSEASRAIKVSHACLTATYALKECDLPLLRQYAKTAYELAPVAPDILVPSAYAALAEQLWLEGDIEKARFLWLGALQEAKKRNYVTDLLWQLHFVATTFFYQGNAGAVARFYNEAHELEKRNQLVYNDALWCIYRTEAELALLRGNWEVAIADTQQAMHITRSWPEEAQLPCLVLTALHHLATQGDNHGFAEQIAQIERITHDYQHHPFVRHRAEQLLLHCWHKQNDGVKMQRWLSEQLNQIHGRTLFDLHHRRNIAQAHLYCGDIEAAEELAEQTAIMAAEYTAHAEQLSAQFIWLQTQASVATTEIDVYLHTLQQQQRLGEITLYAEIFRGWLPRFNIGDESYRIIQAHLPPSNH
ncbi:hypothetical protein DU002_14330 [Corallincola holothuriorum]|uniref:MalT-like winged helix domain-containing protein n=1 Tax=Corallincola holothuriorum TaxID=2282215 RepID=A0A368N549_9GAMM|nr:hypothetical protein [Corallincola holothuriorum]RCU45638.1 hypothetical protein DU002_14330 [Corallincola holothuriorum]